MDSPEIPIPANQAPSFSGLNPASCGTDTPDRLSPELPSGRKATIIISVEDLARGYNHGLPPLRFHSGAPRRAGPIIR
jgi:hypothetical protein